MGTRARKRAFILHTRQELPGFAEDEERVLYVVLGDAARLQFGDEDGGEPGEDSIDLNSGDALVFGACSAVTFAGLQSTRHNTAPRSLRLSPGCLLLRLS
jgi:hypothetical protein